VTGAEVRWLSADMNLFTFAATRAEYDQRHAGKALLFDAGLLLNGLRAIPELDRATTGQILPDAVVV
jgi:hypothetical protein